jgi:hypothetical protein
MKPIRDQVYKKPPVPRRRAFPPSSSGNSPGDPRRPEFAASERAFAFRLTDAWRDMDDHQHGFPQSLPLDLPAPSLKAVPKKRRRFGTLLLLIVAQASAGGCTIARPLPPGRANFGHDSVVRPRPRR